MGVLFASASDVILKSNGVTVGGLRTATINQDFGVEPAHVVGTIMPVELTPQRWTGTIEIEKFFLKKDLSGVATNIDVSSEGVLTVEFPNLELIDKNTGETLAVATNCVVNSSSVTVTANAYLGERATLTALRIVRSSIGSPVVSSGV